MRRTSVSLCALIALSLAVPAARATDADYDTLASALVSPTFNTFEESQSGFSDGVIILRTELARQKLEDLTSPDVAARTLRNEAVSYLESCHQTLQRWREYDAAMPDYAGVADKLLKASPGAFRKDANGNLLPEDKQAAQDLALKAGFEIGKALYNKYEASQERTNFRNNFENSRTKVRDALLKLAQARYSNYALPSQNAAPITVSFMGSLGATFNSDDLYLTNNTGHDLTCCTFCVDLEGKYLDKEDDEYERHLHYVRSWPANATIIAHYPTKGVDGLATDESVDRVHKVKIYLYADQGTAHVDYDYLAEDYEKQLQKTYEDRLNPHFHGKYYAKEDNLVEDSSFGVDFSGGLSTFPIKYATVTLYENGQSISRCWTIANCSWAADSTLYFRTADFNGWHPDKVEVKLEFPDATTFTRTLEWDMK